jgi:hypothetical protein
MIGYDFSFNREVFNYADLRAILEKVMPISPHKMRIGGKNYKFSINKLFDYISTASGISIYDEENKEQVHFNGFGASKHFSLRFLTEGEKLSPEEIAVIVCQKGFSMGYVYDQEFFTWQQASSIQYYEMNDRKHDHLKKFENALGDMEIDTSKNYGRKEFYFHTRLMVAPIMYISSVYEKQFPFEKLLNYGKAEHTELIQDGKIAKIVLFSNPLDSEKRYNLIKSFWFDFHYDELINEFKNSFG